MSGKICKAVFWIFKKLLILCLAVVILVVSPFVISPLYHNLRLTMFSSQLFYYPLPPHTVRLEKQTVCGRLWGTGDGMEFMTMMLITSELSLHELAEYYQDIPFRPVQKYDILEGRLDDHGVSRDVVAATAGPFKPQYSERYSFDFKYIKRISDYTGLYYVVIHDGPYHSWFDLRGM